MHEKGHIAIDPTNMKRIRQYCENNYINNFDKLNNMSKVLKKTTY